MTQFTNTRKSSMFKKTVIITIVLVLVFCQQTLASEISENEVKAIIVKHSVELGIDPALALSIAKMESKFKHNIRSPYGAVGVFQLMPATAKTLGVNPYYLSDNIKGGLMYYKMLYKMFGSTELALAAYNAGPVAVKRNKNVSKGFVNSIMADYNHYKKHPDQSIIQAAKKAPKVHAQPKPVVSTKPSVKTSPVTNGNTAGLTKHTLEMIDVSATKAVKDSLI